MASALRCCCSTPTCPDDRRLTDHLYGGDERYRLSQEIVLGIGGVRLLQAAGYTAIQKGHLKELLGSLFPRAAGWRPAAGCCIT